MDEGPPRHGGRFATTQWSLILAAREGDDPEAREALSALCEAYWPPIFAYLRGRGASRDKALDLTQGFFATAIEKRYLGDARRERGRFRTFLLAAVNHYAANEWDKERAQKRGGPFPSLSLEVVDAGGWRLEPSHGDTPERAFERQWARALIERALKRLRAEAPPSIDARRFERVVVGLFETPTEGYAVLARDLEISEGAARVAAHRMRARFRTLLREEVARTVPDAADVDDELTYLRAALRR